MPRFIVKLNTPRGARYMEWSTIVDAPVTRGMSLDDFKKYHHEMYGAHGSLELPKRLARVEKHGTSCLSPTTVEELLAGNRAGPRETCLTLAEIVEHFCAEGA